MEGIITIDEAIEKFGLPKVYLSFREKFSQADEKNFSFADWDAIHEDAMRRCITGKREAFEVRCVIIGKMIETAQSVVDFLEVYGLTDDGSLEEKNVLEKLSQIKEPEKWLEIFERKERFYAERKVFAYLHGRIKIFFAN